MAILQGYDCDNRFVPPKIEVFYLAFLGIEGLGKKISAVENKVPLSIQLNGRHTISYMSEDGLAQGFEISIGSNIKYPRSFLRFYDVKEAENVRDKLTIFSDKNILKCYTLLKENKNDVYWLAIERVDRSLERDRLEDIPWCTKSTKVSPRYIQLFRDLTAAMLVVTEKSVSRHV